MWWKRYERLLEAKPVSTTVALIDLLAKEQCELLEAFPPQEEQVEWSDQKLAAKLKGRLHELPKPDAPFVALLFEIVRLDLEHEIDRIDWMFRNDKHRDACPTALHVEALHLLWRTCLEVLYTRKDELEAHIKRKDLVEVATRVPAMFAARRSRVQ